MERLVALYEACVARLQARPLTREACERLGGWEGPLTVLGLGKVAGEMAEGVCDFLGPVAGVLAVEEGISVPPGLRAVHGGHPLPNAGSLEAGEALLGAGREGADVLLLVSGGGSSLAEAPVAGVNLERLRDVNQRLLRSGAAIEEMNVVRKHLSRLKGGGFAEALTLAKVRRARALVFVDVPSGDLSAVASGPGMADGSSVDEAVAVAERLGLGALPFRETLKRGAAADCVEHVVACDMGTTARVAASLGASSLSEAVQGPAESWALRFSALPRGCFAAAGEVALTLPANAPQGGRAQQLALVMARALSGERAAFLAAGTDGRDGTSGAAGAVVDGRTWARAVAQGLNPEEAVATFDAARVLKALGCLLPQRHTGAHAGDLYLFQRD